MYARAIAEFLCSISGYSLHSWRGLDLRWLNSQRFPQAPNTPGSHEQEVQLTPIRCPEQPTWSIDALLNCAATLHRANLSSLHPDRALQPTINSRPGFLCSQAFKFGADVAKAPGQAQANQGFGLIG